MFQSGVKSIWTLFLLCLLTSCGGSASNDTAGPMEEGTSSVATDSTSADAAPADNGSGDEGLSDAGSSDGVSGNNGGDEQSTFPSGELNVSPVIDQFSAAPSPLMVNDQIMFTWDISDVNTEDVLTCNLDVDSDGVAEFTVEGCSDTGSVSYNYSKSGDFIATLTVTDFFNQTVTSGAAVVVHPLMLSISSNGPVQAGERLQYEVTISNVSLVPANDINLQHRVPSGIVMDYSDDSIPDASSNCFSCPEGSEVIWRIGTLQAGESLSLAINADVLPDLAPETSITAPFILSSTALIETINREFSTVVNNRPTSDFSMTTPAGPMLSGQDMTVTFDVGNISNSILAAKEVRLILPPGVGVASTELINGRRVDDITGEIVLPLSQIDVQDSRRTSITLGLPDNAVPGLIIPMRARLVDPADNGAVLAAERTVTVSENRVPLILEIAANEDPVVADGRLRYEVSISNVGLVPLNNVVLVYRVPKFVSLDYQDDLLPAATSNCFNCISGSEVVWRLNTIEAGGSTTISMNAEISADTPAGSLVRGEFFSFADSVNSPVSAGVTVGVGTAQDAQLAVSASQDPILAGQSFDVEIVAGNVSSDSLASTSLSLLVPEGLIIDSASDSGAVDSSLRTITWQIGPLEVLSTVKRTTTLTASTDVEPAKILEFESELTFNGVGNRGISARHMTTVSELASAISMSVLPTTTGVSPGGSLGLNVTLTNTSLVPANNVILVYRLPANVSLDYRDDVEPNATSNCFRCIEGSEVVWRLGTIAAGASQQIQINANISADARRGALLVSPFTVFSDQILDTVRIHNIVPVQ